MNVVEDSRKEEVLENITLCDNIIDDLQTKINERKGLLKMMVLSTQFDGITINVNLVKEIINRVKPFRNQTQLTKLTINLQQHSLYLGSNHSTIKH